VLCCGVLSFSAVCVLFFFFKFSTLALVFRVLVATNYHRLYGRDERLLRKKKRKTGRFFFGILFTFIGLRVYNRGGTFSIVTLLLSREQFITHRRRRGARAPFFCSAAGVC